MDKLEGCESADSAEIRQKALQTDFLRLKAAEYRTMLQRLEVITLSDFQRG